MKLKKEIPDITNLVTTTAFTAVENKIPNVSNLIKITDYNINICKIENKITNYHDQDKVLLLNDLIS